MFLKHVASVYDTRPLNRELFNEIADDMFTRPGKVLLSPAHEQDSQEVDPAMLKDTFALDTRYMQSGDLVLTRRVPSNSVVLSTFNKTSVVRELPADCVLYAAFRGVVIACNAELDAGWLASFIWLKKSYLSANCMSGVTRTSAASIQLGDLPPIDKQRKIGNVFLSTQRLKAIRLRCTNLYNQLLDGVVHSVVSGDTEKAKTAIGYLKKANAAARSRLPDEGL